MKFSEINNHLGDRGFVTRKKWGNKSFLVFGMDNCLMCIQKVITNDEYGNIKHLVSKIPYYNLSLDDIKANDWETIDLYWNGSKDDYLPFVLEY